MKQEISIALLKKDMTYLKEGIDDIRSSLETMVPKDDEYKQMKVKVDKLWDNQNRIIGWMMGAGAAGGGVAVLIKSLVTQVIAMM